MNLGPFQPPSQQRQRGLWPHLRNTLALHLFFSCLWFNVATNARQSESTSGGYKGSTYSHICSSSNAYSDTRAHSNTDTEAHGYCYKECWPSSAWWNGRCVHCKIWPTKRP